MRESLNREQLFDLAHQVLNLQKQLTAICQFLELPMPEEKPKEKEFPSMSKAELAKAAGVTSRAFRRSLRKHHAELEKMGIRRSAKILPPQAVKYLYDKGEIDINY